MIGPYLVSDSQWFETLKGGNAKSTFKYSPSILYPVSTIRKG